MGGSERDRVAQNEGLFIRVNKMLHTMSWRLISSIVAVLIGFSMIVVGVVGLFDLKPDQVLTDSEIIRRAKELGMIELKKDINETSETQSEEPTTTD